MDYSALSRDISAVKDNKNMNDKNINCDYQQQNVQKLNKNDVFKIALKNANTISS